MNLPDLAWQVWYGHLAWALVLAALVVGVFSRWRAPSRPMIAGTLAVCALWVSLPGGYSPTHWLGLAFQWPSAAGAAWCGVALHAHWHQQVGCRPMPLWLAVLTVPAGAVLYLDAVGWLSWGWYAAGFAPTVPPLLACVGAAACTGALLRGIDRPQALALLIALTLYMGLRLPTGNLWDTMLDPFVWCWALASLLGRARAAWRGQRWARATPAA